MADTEPWCVVEAGGVRAVAARCDEPGKEPGFVVAQLNTLSMRHARLVCAAPEMARALRLSLPTIEAAGGTEAVHAVHKALRILDGKDRPGHWRLGREVLLRHQAEQARWLRDAIAAFAAGEDLRLERRLARARRIGRLVDRRRRLARHLGVRIGARPPEVSSAPVAADDAVSSSAASRGEGAGGEAACGEGSTPERPGLVEVALL
ncbi:MAG: hypothetical protein ACRD13_13565 [Terriglobales bacterium]